MTIEDYYIIPNIFTDNRIKHGLKNPTIEVMLCERNRTNYVRVRAGSKYPVYI